MKADGDSVLAFLGWCVLGATACLGVLSLLTIGPFVLLLTLMLAGLMLWRVDFGWAMAGMISGASAPLLYVAWLNRGGPGSVCTFSADGGQSCGDEWSPWPFLVVAVLLAAAGVAVFARQRRH
ncbi:MAG TPA: hypothetical protein VH085_13065 [Nocardioides sp.]|nr:hypothetical protein [Nocardioides sp.]